MNKKLMLHSGRVALEALKVSEREFGVAPRYGIAPNDWVGAVWTPDGANGARWFSGFRWGVAPEFWDESHAGHSLYSARAETLAHKAAWRESFKFRRAVVPVDGFWMWRDVDGESRPFLIHEKSGAPLYIAALWHQAQNRGAGELAMVTVQSNRLIEPLGARMPAILRGDEVGVWLEPSIVSERPLQRVLQTLPARDLRVRATVPDATVPDATVPDATVPDATVFSTMGADSLREADDGDARAVITQVYGAEFKPDNPKFAHKRRHVLRENEAGGHVFFRTRSFTRDDATVWHPVVDIEQGYVHCDCPDFRYRHAIHEPDVSTPQWWCKHLARAVANCQRRGELFAR